MAEENGWVVFAQVAGPIVALALGVVGVWNEKIKNQLFGPKLELEVNEPLGHFTHTVGGEIRRYYLIIVKNVPKKAAAENVRLRLVELWRVDAKGDEDRSPSMPLLFLSAAGRKVQIDIKTYDAFTIGFLRQNSSEFTIEEELGLFSFASKVEPGERMKIGLEIQADNLSPSKTKYLIIDWQSNKPVPKCPWPAIPVLRLAD